MEWDIDKNEWEVKTHEVQLNILQIQTLKSIMNHITMKGSWNLGYRNASSSGIAIFPCTILE